MDNLNELGKGIKGARDNAGSALERYHPLGARIDRSRDIFDSITPFEMFFNTDQYETEMRINLVFFPAPNTCCCTICTCSICEFFTGQSSPVFILGHEIMESTTVSVYFNDIKITDFIISDRAEITLTIPVAVEDEVKICYVYELPFNGPTKCEDALLAIAPFTFDPLVEGDFELKAGQVGFSSDGLHITGGIGAAVVCTLHGPLGDPNAALTSVNGGPPQPSAEVTWAQGTIPGWFGGPYDRPVEEIPIFNLLAAVDGDCGTSSYRNTVVLRGPGCVDTFWEYHFSTPVAFCKAFSPCGSGDIPFGIQVFVAGGDWGPINTDINVGGGNARSWLADHNILTTGMRIYFRQCASDDNHDFGGGHVGPFGLWGSPGVAVPEFQLQLTSGRCIDLLTAGLIDENWQFTTP